jgi:uncharacterized glyoxalase superfamily protein PhnB
MPNDRLDHLFLAPGDFDAALAFYRDALGWTVTASWGGNGRNRGCSLSGGGVSITIAEPHDAADRSWSHGVNGVRPTLHIAVDDLAARYRQVAGSGRVVVEPERTHWGAFWFVLRDPDDNLIAFFEAPKAK